MSRIKVNELVKWQPKESPCPNHNQRAVYRVIAIHGDIVLLRRGRYNENSPKKTFYRAPMSELRGLLLDVYA